MISIIIPMKNEAAGLSNLFERLLPILQNCRTDFEIIAINDGSTDQTLPMLLDLQKSLPCLRIADLSRNFGKEAALTAGLTLARGAAAIPLDADLQDQPDLIPQMIEKWQEGYETVLAVQKVRGADNFLKKSTAKGFYRIFNLFSDTHLIPNARDFRLLDRKVIDAFLALPERSRFNKGLFAWLGFKTYVIYFTTSERNTGKSKWGYKKLLRLALDGLTSFSSLPLKIWGYIGFLSAAVGLAYGIYIVMRTIVYGIDLPGYASMLTAILFFGGLNLIGIGVLGEYIARIFLETKQRPLYIIRDVHENQSQ